MIGRVFLGRYEAIRLLGEGGMGRVYLARQLDLGRQVVVKVMHEQIAQDVKFRERFQRETLLMAQFQHPYAVTLYDASLNDPSGPCIIMEYIRGTNLDQLLHKTGRFSPPRLARLVNQLCEVLQAAHSEGIIHRDLKPANLMVIDADTPREKIKVMDFGLAKMIDSGPSPAKAVTDTKVEFAVGTPGYISPEQVAGDTFDHRSDLYSVGVILYELLSGQLPFSGSTTMELMLAHATDPPPTFAEIGMADWVPEPVENVVLACLEKNPNDRPQNARQLAELYEAALYEPPPAAAPAAPAVDEFGGPQFVQPADDPTSIQFGLEAWMPEAIAMVKLRGFIHAMKGEVLDSQPGRITVKLPGVPEPKPRFSLFGLGNRKPPPVVMELQMAQGDPSRPTLLQAAARFRATGGASAFDPIWRAYCSQVFVELRGYLMGSDAV